MCLNSILILSMIIYRGSGWYFNQPKFCSNATWNPNATTFANNTIVGSAPQAIFIDPNNSVYVAAKYNKIIIWSNKSTNPTQIISNNLNDSYSILVTINGDIYADNGENYHQIESWSSNGTHGIIVKNLKNRCWGLFIDRMNTLYCSYDLEHLVVKVSLNDNFNNLTIVSGNGSAGATSSTFKWPNGIFVDLDLNLFVADCGNNRIQKFQFNQRNGTTFVGAAAVGTMTLSCPNGITFDSDNYIYIVEQNKNRIVASSPYGFRCLVGCLATVGSTSYQLSAPRQIAFDNYGNMFISDTGNNRIQKFHLTTSLCNTDTSTTQMSTITMSIVYSDPFYNQPKLSHCATWNSYAITIPNNITTGISPAGLFVDKNNSLYVTDLSHNQIYLWQQINQNSIRTISINSTNSYSIFVTQNGDIYIENSRTIDKWTANITLSTTVFIINQTCHSLFVDVYNTIYCSFSNSHRVVKRLIHDNINMSRTIAGNGTAGNATHMLRYPYGIFVDFELNLYVADCGNNRIQLFKYEQLNGTTLSTDFNCPMDIIRDIDGDLFVTDFYGNRIMRMNANESWCLVGCSTINGLAANQLNNPRNLQFDSYGNLFVTDQTNGRIQKFLLATNSCEQITTTDLLESSTLSTISTDRQISNIFIPHQCPNSSSIGLNCNLRRTHCDIIQPCLNNATCSNNDSIPIGYICTCLTGFDGPECQNNRRLCQLDTCWNNGICNETLNNTFICSCQLGWQGIHCEQKINFCENTTCLNNAVCRTDFLNYTCECLNENYSGRHCELVNTQITMKQVMSKSFAFIAITAVTVLCLFFVLMDVLKYIFGIDVSHYELLNIRRNQWIKQMKNQRSQIKIRTIQRIIYKH